MSAVGKLAIVILGLSPSVRRSEYITPGRHINAQALDIDEYPRCAMPFIPASVPAQPARPAFPRQCARRARSQLLAHPPARAEPRYGLGISLDLSRRCLRVPAECATARVQLLPRLAVGSRPRLRLIARMHRHLIVTRAQLGSTPTRGFWRASHVVDASPVDVVRTIVHN